MAARFFGRRFLLTGIGGSTAAYLTGCGAGAADAPWPAVPRHAPRDPASPPGGAAASAPLATAPDEAAAVDTPSVPVLDLPPRSPNAETGSAFLDRNEGLGRSAMDDAVSEAILAGNVPAYQRTLVPITIEGPGLPHAVLHVMCDYLAVGSDEDFVRMPMTSAAAQRIADRVGASLPTPKLVDEIYRQATVKLWPSWIDGGPTEGTLADYATHHASLEKRRVRDGHPLGVLTAGHKKDIVLCRLMFERPGRVAIYGWHKKEGVVVQPLSTAHSCRYADYSHGVRLIDQQMTIDGEVFRMSDVLQDAELAWLLSDDGPLSLTEYPRALPPYPGG